MHLLKHHGGFVEVDSDLDCNGIRCNGGIL